MCMFPWRKLHGDGQIMYSVCVCVRACKHTCVCKYRLLPDQLLGEVLFSNTKLTDISSNHSLLGSFLLSLLFSRLCTIQIRSKCYICSRFYTNGHSSPLLSPPPPGCQMSLCRPRVPRQQQRSSLTIQQTAHAHCSLIILTHCSTNSSRTLFFWYK